MSFGEILKETCLFGPVAGMVAAFVLWVGLAIVWQVVKRVLPRAMGSLSSMITKSKNFNWLSPLSVSLSIGVFAALWNYSAIRPFTLLILLLSVVGTLPYSILITGMGGENHSTQPPTPLPTRQLYSLMSGAPLGALIGSLYLLLLRS